MSEEESRSLIEVIVTNTHLPADSASDRHGNALRSHLANRMGRALGLRRRHIQVEAGTQRLRPGRQHQHALRLQSRRHRCARAVRGIDLKPHQVRFHSLGHQAQAGTVLNRLCDHLGVAVVVGQAVVSRLGLRK